MTIELWVHVAELVIVVFLVPTGRSLVGVVIGLRDATRDLNRTTMASSKMLDDHESRIRHIERRSGYDRREFATADDNPSAEIGRKPL